MVSRVTILCALLAVACGSERPTVSGYSGTSRSFTTTATETPFTTYLMVDDYRNAAASIVAEPTGADAVEAARVRAAHEAWLERRAAQRPPVLP